MRGTPLILAIIMNSNKESLMDNSDEKAFVGLTKV
jgi:hypothetical protein